ncbi:DUF7118 family protein [Halovenus marina]|uniref:DUF7118 family protein n=1 Tax=Halovenus marina TaxID=3396621 RepID=UPI003F54B25A
MSSTTTAPETAESELETLETRLDGATERVEEFGREDLERLADIYESFVELLDRYEEDVVGDGEFETFIEFQGEIAAVVEEMSEDLLLYETFEECDDRLQQRRLHESDFEYVYEQLEPIADLVARLDEHEQALAAYRERRRELQREIRELDEQIDHLERLSRLGEADIDAPTERLREPIETYNNAVTEAFESFKRDRPAREVLAFLDRMEQYPLVEFESPPTELHEYLSTSDPGTEPIPTLLEYADYSRSKLDHYVDDSDAFKHVLGGKQTYFQRLDAEPLRVDWPPPSAEHLRWRCQELTAAVNRFAPDVVEHLRAVERLPQETEYERLQESALARAELSDDERERLASGSVESELETARTEREQLQELLEQYPER